MEFVRIILNTGPVFYPVCSIKSIQRLSPEAILVVFIDGQTLEIESSVLDGATLVSAAEVLSEISG